MSKKRDGVEESKSEEHLVVPRSKNSIRKRLEEAQKVDQFYRKRDEAFDKGSSIAQKLEAAKQLDEIHGRLLDAEQRREMHLKDKVDKAHEMGTERVAKVERENAEYAAKQAKNIADTPSPGLSTTYEESRDDSPERLSPPTPSDARSQPRAGAGGHVSPRIRSEAASAVGASGAGSGYGGAYIDDKVLSREELDEIAAGIAKASLRGTGIKYNPKPVNKRSGRGR